MWIKSYCGKVPSWQYLILKAFTQKAGSDLVSLQVTAFICQQAQNYQLEKLENGTKDSAGKRAFRHCMHWCPDLGKCQTNMQLMCICLA